MECGVEEPLRPNAHLLAMSEDGQSIELAEFGILELNRYSFVADDASAEAVQSLVQILARVAAALATEAQWLAAWQHHESGYGHIRCRVLKSHLIEAGWTTVTTDGIGIGTKPVPRLLEMQAPPSELRDRLNWAMILGQHQTPQMLTQSPFVQTIKAFALTQRLDPSREFLRQFGSGLAYPARNGSDMRVGLVLILPVSLQLTLRRFLEEGIVSQIYFGEQAPDAWR